MNTIKNYIIGSVAAVLFCGLAVSCEQDNFRMIPETERALKLITSVDGMVSTAGNPDFWSDGDIIGVRIGDYPVAGQYVLNTDGTIKDAIEALAWPKTDDFVTAWFPYMTEGEEVSITDQSEGHHKFDFLWAASDRAMNYKEIVNLHFKHQMVKVRCELIKGDGVTEEDLKTAEIQYYGIPTVRFSEKGISGKGDPTYITSGSDYSALLLPQDISGLPFIKINLTLTINDARIPKTLVYTPEDGAEGLWRAKPTPLI